MGTSMPLGVALLAGFALAGAESGLGLGVVVPGETLVVVLAGSVDGATAHVALWACVALGASAGDHVGYGLGRRAGPRLRESRLVTRVGRHHWDRAVRVVERHGPAAVVLTRLLPVVRTVTPAAAGAAHLSYRRFLPASATGSALWSAVYVGGGSAAGVAVRAALDAAGPVTALLALVTGLTLATACGLRAMPRADHHAVVTLRAGGTPPHHADRPSGAVLVADRQF